MTEYHSQASSKGKSRQWLERLLLFAGLAGIGVWGWSVARTTAYQQWTNWAFDRQLAGNPHADFRSYLVETGSNLRRRIQRLVTGKDSVRQNSPAGNIQVQPLPVAQNTGSARPPAEKQLVARLSIPRLGLHATVREGTADQTLSLALGHIAGTALPGQNGNVGVAGHRDTLFHRLRDIAQKDEIRMETPDAVYVYKVESSTVVKPSDVVVLKPGLYPEVTLVTCYPFTYAGSAPERFVVKARQVAQIPLVQAASTQDIPHR